MASADLLLHPVRLRIIKAFLSGRALTTSQLAAELDDVPTGSVYRHVSRLAKEGVLRVVAEQRVRGAVERTYTLRMAAASIQPGETVAMTPDDHARAFTAYIAGVLDHFDRYMATGPAEACREAGYRIAAMWLTDGESAQLFADLAAVIAPRLGNAPGKGRRRHFLYSIALPDPARGTTSRPPGPGDGGPRED
jgi:predicted ArsR family transcriptional regulator